MPLTTGENPQGDDKMEIKTSTIIEIATQNGYEVTSDTSKTENKFWDRLGFKKNVEVRIYKREIVLEKLGNKIKINSWGFEAIDKSESTLEKLKYASSFFLNDEQIYSLITLKKKLK
jgi:hypothetical protein